MTDDEKQTEQLPAQASPEAAAPEGDAPPVKSAHGGIGSLVAVLALVVAVATAADIWFVWKAVDKLRDSAQSINATTRDLRGEIESRVAVLQNQLDESLQQSTRLQESIAGMQNRADRSEAGWMLAEAEYLVRIANRMVQFQRDVPSAIAALTAADERLRDLSDPTLLPIRERLAEDISALKTVPSPDYDGMAVTLDSLARRVDALPLNSAEAVAPTATAPDVPADSEDWRALARSVWAELKALVVVRRLDRPSAPMLPPDQEYYLRQNLRLQIESARLAMLRRDVTSYEASLSTAYDWLNANFDVTDSRVDGMSNEIKTLSGMQIKPPLPDISGALKLLRSRLRSGDGTAVPPSPASAGEAG